MSSFAARVLLVAAVCVLPMAPAVAIDPKYARNLTVYHVNPHPLGAIPINMDTADAAGDLFFDMHNVFLGPLECPHGAASGHGCNNPEAIANDLVVNKLMLNVDTRYSGYAKCNIGVNGTDGHGNYCKDGTYCCFCAGANRWGPPGPCNATVGRENVRNYFGSSSHGGSCYTGSPDYECWRSNLGNKFTETEPGWWYSPQSLGYCPDHPGSATNCTWNVVSVEKIVDKKCHDQSLWGSVRKVDPAGCFDNCGSIINTTDPCFIRCFFETVLGPDAGQPHGAVAGMPLDDLIAAWDRPFASDDASQGGCPGLPHHSSISSSKVL